MLELGLRIVVAYMLGSIMGSLVIGRLAGGVDIRKEGSGNAGGTNALRTHGGWFAGGTMLIDVGKGVVAVLLVPTLDLAGLADPTLPMPWVVAACGAAAVAGHVWPLWFGFRGGKGAATLLGIIAVLSPFTVIPMLGVWILTLTSTGWVGLSTILAAFAAPISLAITAGPTDAVFALTAVMAAFIAYTHRGNIERMRAGSEHRFEKAMLFSRR